jgi:hypothetical protein
VSSRAPRTALALALAALAGVAAARPAPPRRVDPLALKLEDRRGVLLASLDLTPAFPPELQRHLGNGLTNVIALHVALLPEGRDEPTVIHVRVIEVLYDVWDESYGVVVRDPGHPEGRSLLFPDWTALRAYLAQPRVVDLGPVAALADGSWVVHARVEVNPVSKELLQRTREFIANPAAGARVGGSSRSVLGAMASYLLAEPDAGAEVFVLRSAPFTASEVRR